MADIRALSGGCSNAKHGDFILNGNNSITIDTGLAEIKRLHIYHYMPSTNNYHGANMYDVDVDSENQFYCLYGLSNGKTPIDTDGPTNACKITDITGGSFTLRNVINGNAWVNRQNYWIAE